MESIAVGAIGLVVGWVLSLASQLVTARMDRKRRVEERAEGAARNLLSLFFQVRTLFRGAYNYDSEVDRDKLWDLVARIREEVALLDDSGKERLTLATDVIDDFWGAMEWAGDTPARIAYFVWREAQESLRRILRDKALAPLDPDVKRLHDSMVDYRTTMEDAMREHEEERRRERGG